MSEEKAEYNLPQKREAEVAKQQPKYPFSDESVERLEHMLERLSVSELGVFTSTMLQRFGTQHKIDVALDAADVLVDYLKKRHMYNEMNPNKQTDTAICAVLLHNLFYDRTTLEGDARILRWKSVFQLREEAHDLELDLIKLNYDCYDAIEYIFQIVEAQMGEDMPVVACRPVNGQITYIVWEVLWFFYSYLYKDEKEKE